MKPESRFDFFDDPSDLVIKTDEVGIVSVSGMATYRGADFSVSLSRPKKMKDTGTAPPLIRGTVSIRDPRTGKVMDSEAKKRDSAHSSVKASKDLKINSLEVKAVAAAVQRAVAGLYSDNQDQINVYSRAAMPPGMITPMDAVRLHLEQYIRDCYPDSNEDSRKRRSSSIRSTAALLPNTPMANITSEDIAKAVKKHDISKQKVTDLRLFWDYCISHSICAGTLPFDDASSKRKVPKDYRSLNKSAGSVKALSFDVWCKILDTLYNLPKSAVGCGIMLLMSGFDTDFISKLTWSDLVIDNDTVYVRYYRNELAGSKHIFSRDLFADAAVYVSDYYREISAVHNVDELQTLNVLWSFDKGKILPKKKLTVEAVRLMVMSGAYADDITDISAYKRPISHSLLSETYAALLETRCGLKWDKDSLYYLTGRVLPSSTYSSYESHTDSAARARLRQLMMPLSRPQKIIKTYTTAKEGDFSFIRYRPSMTNERVTVTGSITLAPGETLIVRSRYGMEGSIKTLEADENPTK